MIIRHFTSEQAAQTLNAEDTVAKEGVLWFEVRAEDTDWPDLLKQWRGVAIHESHVRDTQNSRHPPFYDGTESYDMIILRGLRPDYSVLAPRTQPLVFFIGTDWALSVGTLDDPAFEKVRQRLQIHARKQPVSLEMLLYVLLSQVVDELLSLREPVAELLEHWQSIMLDPVEPFDEWHTLSGLRSHLQRLSVHCEENLHTLETWREYLTLSQNLQVRYNDLVEHQQRTLNSIKHLKADLDALMQIYFSAASQRTNETMKFLAVISAVFLPLNLIVGFFGMNVSNMPLQAEQYGVWLILGGMSTLSLTLLLWFNYKGWIKQFQRYF